MFTQAIATVGRFVERPMRTMTSLRPLIRSSNACERRDQYANTRWSMTSTNPPPSVGKKCRGAVDGAGEHGRKDES